MVFLREQIAECSPVTKGPENKQRSRFFFVCFFCFVFFFCLVFFSVQLASLSKAETHSLRPEKPPRPASLSTTGREHGTPPSERPLLRWACHRPLATSLAPTAPEPTSSPSDPLQRPGDRRAGGRDASSPWRHQAHPAEWRGSTPLLSLSTLSSTRDNSSSVANSS